MQYGLIGEKLGHSFSKEIHTALCGYEYELKELAPEELDGFMKAKDFRAINVTIPYKQAVIPYLDEIEDTAARIGAVNTIVNREGKLYGYNTDYLGMRELARRAGIDFRDRKVLIAGSGGTSRTATAVAQSLGAGEIHRVSRSGRDGCITYGEAAARHGDAEIWINTTPAGMYPKVGNAPFDIEAYPALTGVIDAVYNPLRSFLVVEAQERGIRALGGLYMLVAQAIYAAQLFTGQTFPPETFEEVYQNILSSKRNLVLIGMPGSGKTTIGKHLAANLLMDFVDVDDVIVERIRMPISEFFAQNGEKAFRDVESEVIREVSRLQNTVIATGGGAVLRKRNMELLKGNGTIYFLDRPIEHLVTSDDRPLSSNRDALEKRFQERYGFYLEESERRIAAVQDIGTNIDNITRDFTM